MRNTWAAYLVDAATGRIEWTLGGRKSSFKFGPGAGFEWQHDVRMQPQASTVSLFDDHCCQLTGGGTSVKATGASRGLVHQARPERPHRLARRAVRRARRLRIGIHGRHAAAVGRRRVRRLGLGTLLLRIRPLRQAAASKASCPSRTAPTARSSSRGKGCPKRSRPARRGATARPRRSTRAGTARRKLASWRVLGASAAGARCTRSRARRSRASRPSISVPSGYASFEVEALDANGQALATSDVFSPAG